MSTTINTIIEDAKTVRVYFTAEDWEASKDGGFELNLGLPFIRIVDATCWIGLDQFNTAGPKDAQIKAALDVMRLPAGDVLLISTKVFAGELEVMGVVE